MTKKNTIFLIICLLFCLWPAENIVAQNEIDSLYRMNIDTVNVDTVRLVPDSVPYLPLKYVHQRRYLPKGEPFRTPHAWQRLYFALSSGLYGLTDKEWQRTNVPVSVSVGYDFNRHSGVRLSGTYVQIPREHTRTDLQSVGADMDYMFNVTNYLHGFHPHRNQFNFGLAPGVGIIYSHRQDEKSLSWKAHLALHFGYTLGYNTEIYAEPWFGLTDDRVNLSVNNPAAYDVLYGVRVGAAIHLRPRSGGEPDTITNHRPFLEFSQGVVIPLDAIAHGTHTLGTDYQVSIGEWINPSFGLRLGFAGSQFYWDAIAEERVVIDDIQVHPAVERWQSAAYMAGRLEALFNPLNMSRRGREREAWRRVDLNIALGAELGWMMKYGVPRAAGGLKKYYYGLTAAPQLLYAVSRRGQLFIEPRITLVNYSIPYSNSDDSKVYSDKVITVNVGARIQPLTPKERALRNADFSRHLWFSAGVMGMKHIHPDKVLGAFQLNGGAQVGAAVELAPLFAVRLRGEYLRYGYSQSRDYMVYDLEQPIKYTALWEHTNHLLTLKLGYLLNMNNLLQGYDASRRMNVYLELGPMYGWNLKRRYAFADGELPGGEDIRVVDPYADVNSSVGAFGSILADFCVTPQWSIQANTEMGFYLADHFLNQTFARPLGGWTIGISLGAAYKLSW
ncbi:MAG: hypothetical protein IJ767_07285 [Bacteroidaceae bacterium]|nr:hypothetical protein [Bacteroidaceae bacterium]